MSDLWLQTLGFLKGQTLYSKELQALAMALQGAKTVRKGPNKDRTMHPFHAFALTTVVGFAGGYAGFFLMGKPTPMVTNGDMNIVACLIAHTIVNYTPGDIGYKLVNFLPVVLIITSYGQLFRALGMMKFIRTGFEEASATPYYPIPIIGPVLYGSLLGNWGGFFIKGFNGHLANGVPWPFQNAMVMGTFYHLFAHDDDGPLGSVLRSYVYFLVDSTLGPQIREGVDDETFAFVATSIFMQFTGVLMLPQFLGPSFSIFYHPYKQVIDTASVVVLSEPKKLSPVPADHVSRSLTPVTEKPVNNQQNTSKANRNKRRKKKKVA